MRRRRKKNPLLTRIIVISLVAHAVALPIAAHFGAFEKVRRQFGSSNVVVINTPPIEEKKAPEKAKPKEKPQRTEAKKSNASAKRLGSQSKPNPNAPKVIAGTGPDDGTGATADANATGKAGVVPTDTTKTTTPAGNMTPPSTATPPPPVVPKEQPPISTPTPPVVTTPPPVQPKAKKFVQVETSYAPEPAIPDDLRSEPFEKTAVVEADVDKQGHPENIKIVQSTGTGELDTIGLDTAKKYRFTPATLDDEPVEGHVRFRIIFKVE